MIQKTKIHILSILLLELEMDLEGKKGDSPFAYNLNPKGQKGKETVLLYKS